MSLIRPELRAGFRRWREALTGLGVAALGLWLVLVSHGLTRAFGWAVVLGGGALVLTGVQLGRFRSHEGMGEGLGGPGLVDVTEARVSYFAAPGSALAGGEVALGALQRVELLGPPARSGLRRRLRGGPPAFAPPLINAGPLWLLSEAGAPPLAIPLSAGGADALFDAFASLPGLQTERMLAALSRMEPGRVTIWQAPARSGVAAPRTRAPEEASPAPGQLASTPGNPAPPASEGLGHSPNHDQQPGGQGAAATGLARVNGVRAEVHRLH